jgi:hypothetical protein
MEAFGRANQVEHEGTSYLTNMAGTPEQNPANPGHGKWHVLLERHHILIQKILGKNKVSRTDPMMRKITELLRSAGFEAVAVGP